MNTLSGSPLTKLCLGPQKSRIGTARSCSNPQANNPIIALRTTYTFKQNYRHPNQPIIEHKTYTKPILCIMSLSLFRVKGKGGSRWVTVVPFRSVSVKASSAELIRSHRGLFLCGGRERAEVKEST